MTLDLALAELAGGITGLSGEYARSERRVARIRSTVGDAAVTAVRHHDLADGSARPRSRSRRARALVA